MNIYTSKTEYLEAEIKRLHEELQEQCRINGMGAEREARLMAVNQELVEALKLALEAIEACLSAGTEAEDQDASDKLCDARAAIRKVLEQPAQKRPQNCGTGYCSCIECLFEQPNIANYLEKDNSEQPAQPSKPLTDEQIKDVAASCMWWVREQDILDDAIELARAIEAAHGIKGDA